MRHPTSPSAIESTCRILMAWGFVATADVPLGTEPFWTGERSVLRCVGGHDATSFFLVPGESQCNHLDGLLGLLFTCPVYSQSFSRRYTTNAVSQLQTRETHGSKAEQSILS